MAAATFDADRFRDDVLDWLTERSLSKNELARRIPFDQTSILMLLRPGGRLTVNAVVAVAAHCGMSIDAYITKGPADG